MPPLEIPDDFSAISSSILCFVFSYPKAWFQHDLRVISQRSCSLPQDDEWFNKPIIYVIPTTLDDTDDIRSDTFACELCRQAVKQNHLLLKKFSEHMIRIM